MAKLLTSVKGHRVLITGGCSGLGAATARYLLDRGARVLIVDHTEAAAARVPPPKSAVFCLADVTDEAQVSAAVATAEKEFGGLDAAINCAGISFAARMYNWNTDSAFGVDDFRHILMTNALGTFNVCRLAARLMAKNRPANSASDAGDANASCGSRGVVVNTSSTIAFDGQTTHVSYAASKAAVAAMTLPMARDLAPLGIRVCSIAPGYFNSPMSVRDTFTPKLLKFLADHNRAIYRLGRPEEFAGAVEAILLNPMLNGVTIRLDAASRGMFYNRHKKVAAVIPVSDSTAGTKTTQSDSLSSQHAMGTKA